MKFRTSLLAVIMGMMSLGVQAKKDCAELKTEIEAQLKAKGVKAYQLDVVAKNEVGAGTVIGQCNGDSQRIVYRRGGAPIAAEEAAVKQATPPNKPAAPLGNY
ncbi:MAG: DUF1161 domain-containing protein [Panacagrimonas sp.]